MILEKFEKHEQLNDKLFSNEKLKKDVRDKLLEIVEEFKDYIDVDIKVLDVLLVGSNASYNYTDNSDIDLHIVTNFDYMEDTTSVISQILFNLERSLFNKAYDISIKDIPVEVYVEDVNANTASNGIYSVLEDMWIKKPKHIDIPEIDISKILKQWKDKIEKVLENPTIEKIENIIDMLYLIRKNSILVDGEYSTGNFLFKELRNLGYLDKLKEKLNKLKSQELSLECYLI